MSREDGILTFADLLVPDVNNGASTTAMDTLSLVLANDGVLERGTVRKDENGVSFTGLGLALADAG